MRGCCAFYDVATQNKGMSRRITVSATFDLASGAPSATGLRDCERRSTVADSSVPLEI